MFRVTKRKTLWVMLFSGILCNTICNSNLNIAIIGMHKGNRTAMESNVKISEWSEGETSLLLGAFYWFYGIAQCCGGVFCYKYGAKRTFFISNFLMAVISFFIPTVADVHLNVLIVFRIIQGFFGGLAIYSAPVSLISKWIPPHDRAKYMTVTMGFSVGLTISYPIFGQIILLSGWRVIFYISGLVTLFWCFLWSKIVFDCPKMHPRIGKGELQEIEKSIGDVITEKKQIIPWKSIFLSLPYIANSISVFGTVFTLTMYTVRMPSFFKDVYKLSPTEVGYITGIPFAFMCAFSFAFGIYSDYLQREKAVSRTLIRKYAVLTCSVFGGFITIAIGVFISDIKLVVVFFGLSLTLSGAFTSGGCANIIDLSPNFCSILQGIQGILTALAGVFLPILVTVLTQSQGDSLDNWSNVFYVIGLLNVIPGCLFLVFGDGEVQAWNYSAISREESSEAMSLRKSQNTF